MVLIDVKGQTLRVNSTKLRENPDNWHDMVIPGLEGRDDTPTVPGEADTSSTDHSSLQASLRVSLERKGSPKLWTIEEGKQFFQFFVESDILSATVAAISNKKSAWGLSFSAIILAAIVPVDSRTTLTFISG